MGVVAILTLIGGVVLNDVSGIAALGASRSASAKAAQGIAWSSVTAGHIHTCGIHFDRSLWCWGSNGSGELGLGYHHKGVSRPHQVGADQDWITVQVGYEHTCGIRLDHSLWCWGSNTNGQLGTGDPNFHWTPVQVGSEESWKSLALGSYHTCGIRLDHTLWCWGLNDHGQLGLGDGGIGTDRWSPTQVGVDGDWVQVHAAYSQTCAIRVDHTLWCWGLNLFGQLGLGDTSDRYQPTRVGVDADWATVRTGLSEHTCGTRLDGTLWCWGHNRVGQLGLGDTHDRHLPTQVGTSTWARVQPGGAFTCGIRDSTLWCWGGNHDGQLGLGDRHARDEPTQVGDDRDWAGIQPGAAHTCALRRDHTLWCWGYNGNGQLGLGDHADRRSPVRVGH